MLESYRKPMKLATIRPGLILYRASLPEDDPLSTRTCPDTGKTGVYFYAYHSYMAECMCIEQLTNMIISVYRVSEPIIVSIGKYGFTRGYSHPYPTTGWESVRPEDDISHYDTNIHSTDVNVVDCTDDYHYHTEVFLSPYELKKLTLLTSYHVTVGECIRRWYKQSWFETMVDYYVRRYGNSLKPHYDRHENVDDTLSYEVAINSNESISDDYIVPYVSTSVSTSTTDDY